MCVCVYVDLRCLGLEGHEAGWSVCQDVEVRGGWGTHGCGPALRVHLVVDQTPLLQEGVDSAAEETQECYTVRRLETFTFSGLHTPHDCTHVSCQVPAAGGGRQVLLRVQPVGVNHEVPVRQVTERRHTEIF